MPTLVSTRFTALALNCSDLTTFQFTKRIPGFCPRQRVKIFPSKQECRRLAICSTSLRQHTRSSLRSRSTLFISGQSVSQTRSRSNVRATLERWRDESEKSQPQYAWEDALLNTKHKPGESNEFVKSDPTTSPDINDDTIEAGDEFSSVLDRLITEGDANESPASQANVGDFVDVRIRLEHTQCGVFLGMVGRYAATYLASGKLHLHPSQHIKFVSPKFTTAKELESVLECLPKASFSWDTNFKRAREDFGLAIEDIIPQRLGWPLRRKLLQFSKEADNCYREYAWLFDSIHKRLAAEDRPRLISADQLVRMLGVGKSGPPDPSFLFAMYRVASSTLGLSYSDSAIVGVHTVEIYSKRDLEIFKDVQRCVRAFTDEQALLERGKAVTREIATQAARLRRFVKTYRRLRDYSRPLMVHYTGKSRDDIQTPVAFADSVNEANSEADFQRFEAFTNDDLMFVRFLMLQAFKGALAKDITLRSTFNSVLRACEPQAATFDVELARNVLIYMGLVHPAESLLPLDVHIHDLPPGVADSVAYMEARAEEGGSTDQSFGLEKDSMHAIRHDWGNLAAFAIDSETVSVFDDAISYEPVPDYPDQSWIRVHIAEPTAFIHPQSSLAKLARGRNKALYFAAGRLSMFPVAITNKFSLGAQKPVMTYSARLDRSGKVLETSIQPGVLNNIIFCTPGTINSITFKDERTFEEEHLFGAGDMPDHDAHAMSDTSPQRTYELEQFSETFREALSFVNAFRQFRGEEVFPNKNQSRSIAVNSTNPDRFGTILDQPRSRPSFYFESPAIEVKKVFGNTQDTPASKLVEGASHLANAIAGEWCARRRIPIPFHGLTRTFGGLNADDFAAMREAARHAATDTSLDPDKYWQLRARLMRMVGVRTVMADPVPHLLLKDPHRARITNPLRSYIDLVATWQIESALLEEHRRGASLLDRPSAEDSSFLTFHKRKVEAIIQTSMYHDSYARYYQTLHTQAVQFNAIARALATDDPTFPKRLTASVSNISSLGEHSQTVRARIAELDISAKAVDVYDGLDGNAVRVGDLWEVEILSVPAIPHKEILLSFVRRLSAGPADVVEQPLPIVEQTLPVVEGAAAPADAYHSPSAAAN